MVTDSIQIFHNLLAQVQPINFKMAANLNPEERLTSTHLRILTIYTLLDIAARNSWGLCKNQSFVYVYNASYWTLVDPGNLTSFLGEVAQKMGVPWEKAQDFKFRNELYAQFIETARFKQLPQRNLTINLSNGTLEFQNKQMRLRQHDPRDFLTYQLPFAYDPNAQCLLFQTFLNKCVPNESAQMVLAEFIAWSLVGELKLEKVLLLYGPGANGKSVFFQIVTALLGSENISNYSLSSLCGESGYFRAMIANKLINYVTEINGKLEASTFKTLASGEPIEARLPYSSPMIIREYAKLIANVNQLPHEVEHTHAFFRRFLIIPWNVTIPENQQDPDLANKIIATELSGVFNWALWGLARILHFKKFTDCDISKQLVAQYQLQSDSVALFLDEGGPDSYCTGGYEKSTNAKILFKDLYDYYSQFCSRDGYRVLSKVNFKKRLESRGVDITREGIGHQVHLKYRNPV